MMDDFHNAVNDESGSSRDPDHELARAKQKALVLLSDMDRTESQMRNRLRRSGFSEAAVSEAVDDAINRGYIDDERYASHFIDIMKEKKSRRMITLELENRGISRDMIESAMKEAGEWDEKPLIRKLLLKKIPETGVSDSSVLRRAAASLARKGFQISDIVSVLDTILENRYI